MAGEITNLNDLLTLALDQHGAATEQMHIIEVLVYELRVVLTTELALILWVVPTVHHLLLFGCWLFGLFLYLVYRLFLHVFLLALHILDRDFLVVSGHLLLRHRLYTLQDLWSNILQMGLNTLIPNLLYQTPQQIRS